MKKYFYLAVLLIATTLSTQAQTVIKNDQKTTVSTVQSDMQGVDSIVTYATTVTKTIEHVYDSLIIDTTKTILTHRDSLKVTKPTVTVADSTRRGHYIQVFVGAGYGQMGDRMDVITKSSMTDKNGTTSLGDAVSDLKRNGHAGGLIQVQYAYFFHENIGVSLGVGASTYGGGNRVSGENKDVYRYSDDNNYWNDYNKLEDLGIRYRTWLIDIPVGLQFQGLLTPKVGLYGGVGVDLGIHMKADQWYTDGIMRDTRIMNDKEAFNLVHPLSNKGWEVDKSSAYEWYRTSGWAIQDSMMNLEVKKLQVGVTADFGVILPINYQSEMLLGVYARATVNNIAPDEVKPTQFSRKIERSSNGGDTWKSIVGDDPSVSMAYYTAPVQTQLDRMFPWQLGIKLGYQWRYVRRHTYTPVEYKQIETRDTLYNYTQRKEKKIAYTTETETTYTYDTIMSPVDEIRRLMDKAIIWFDFDSYVPKLDPIDILDNIALILVHNPGLKVEVNGHTCIIGNRNYNQKLSERRAKAVADRLVALGVHPDQMIIQGFCSDKPYFSESHQLYLDRRCEIVPIDETNEKHIIHKETKGENASTETIVK